MLFFSTVCFHFLLYANGKNFSRVIEILDEAAELIPNLAFSASTEADGRVFTYEHGHMTMDKVVPVYSASKWISGITILRQVGLGKFSLDDRICKFFDWWSCDSTNDPFGLPRANITVRQAMSFLDGTIGAGSGLCPNHETTYEECTIGLYKEEKIWKYVPNSTFDYNEYHLQLAGTVAEKVAGKTIDLLLNDTLSFLNMTNSLYEGGKTPDISASLSTTGNDYDKFLHSLYHKTLPDINDELLSEMESDYTVDKQYSESGRTIQGWLGHYGLANWLDCSFIDYNDMNLWPWCEEHQVRSCVGALGYYPVLDRSRKFWNQVVVGKSLDPAQFILATVTGKMAKEELDVILAPEVPRGENPCVSLSFLLENDTGIFFGTSLRADDVERVHLLARKFQRVLGC